jgi:hypothetical protein
MDECELTAVQWDSRSSAACSFMTTDACDLWNAECWAPALSRKPVTRTGCESSPDPSGLNLGWPLTYSSSADVNLFKRD